MLIEKEKELRNSLTEEEYFKLCSCFIYHSNTGNKFKDILNIYFDTPSHDIDNSNMILRLRTIDRQKPHLTLKISNSKNESVEIHQILNINELSLLNNKGIVPVGKILDELKKRNIETNKIEKRCELKTKRFETIIDDCLLVIDKNTYFDIVDFDFEIEYKNKKNAIELFNKILNTFNIKKTENYITKGRRALNCLK
ncbi:MAG: CYTH domain-containing protein [Bacilli bacterium]